MKSIGIIGCGWLGSKLAQRLESEFSIYATARKQETVNELASFGYSVTKIDFSEEKKVITDQWDTAPALDAIVILIPFSLRKSTDESLKCKMENLFTFIGDFNSQLLFASSTGVYPKQRDTFTEDDLPTRANTIEHQVKQCFPMTNVLRLGGLMGDNRLLSKYNVTNLEDPVNHVHYDDVCSIIIRMIEDRVHDKLYNVVAPLHPAKDEVIKAQLNNSIATTPDSHGRIISSSKLIAELEFDFKYPDPRTFHL
ncbi:MAG: hypothetical protein AAF363_09360 [Bacteroidota bacterium]